MAKKPRTYAEFNFNNRELGNRVPFISSTSSTTFTNDSPYNFFYRYDTLGLGILAKKGKNIIGHFSTKTSTNNIRLNKLSMLAIDQEDGYYLIDSFREKLIYSWNTSQPIDKYDFSINPFVDGRIPTKVLVLRQDDKRIISIWGGSPMVTLGFFTSVITKFMKPSDNVITLRGINLLLAILHRQYSSLPAFDERDVKNFLHLFKPAMVDWSVKDVQINNVLDLILVTMGNEKKSETLDEKIVDIKNERLESVTLTDLIIEGFPKEIDYEQETEIIIDIPLEGKFSSISEMFTQYGIIWVYTLSKEISSEEVLEELDLPVAVGDIQVISQSKEIAKYMKTRSHRRD